MAVAVSQTELRLLLTAKDEGSRAMQSVQKEVVRTADEVERQGSRMQSAMSGAKLAFAGLAVGIGGAVALGAKFAQAAAEEEVGIARLAQAVKNAGGDWDVLGASVEGQIAKWQTLTAFSDGEMRDALAALTASTGSVQEAMKRLPTAMDLARGAGMDLAGATKLVGKVTDESVNVFKRLGITVQEGADATAVLEEVQKRFGGQSAAFAQTAQGQWKIFGDQLSDLQEDIGAALLPAFRGAAEVLQLVVGNVRQVISGDFASIFANIRTKIPELAQAVMRYVVDVAPRIGAQLLEWGKQFIAWIGPAAREALNGLMGLLSQVIGWLGDHSEEIGQTLVSWGLEFGKFIFTTAIPAIVQNLPGIVLALGKWVVTEAIPGVLRIFLGVGKGIAEGIWNGIGAAWGWLVDQVKGAIMQLPQFVRDFLGIRSPSTVFAEIGEEIPRGLALGISSAAGVALAAVDELASQMSERMTQALAAARAGLAAVATNALHTLTGGISFASVGQTVDAARMALGDAIVGPDGTVVYRTPGLRSVSFLPNRHQGGMIPATGPYVLEKGERVVTKDRAAGGMQVGPFIINGTVVDLDALGDVVRDAVAEGKRRGGFHGVIPEAA